MEIQYTKNKKVFPAYAGVILGSVGFVVSYISLSRIRGGDPINGKAGKHDTESFPHTRG